MKENDLEIQKAEYDQIAIELKNALNLNISISKKDEQDKKGNVSDC